MNDKWYLIFIKYTINSKRHFTIKTHLLVTSTQHRVVWGQLVLCLTSWAVNKLQYIIYDSDASACIE